MNKDVKIAALLGIIQQYRIVLTFYSKKKSGGLYARHSLRRLSKYLKPLGLELKPPKLSTNYRPLSDKELSELYEKM